MADARFFRRSGPFALGEIAHHIGAALPEKASAQFAVHDVAALDTAKSGELSMFSDIEHRDSFINGNASVVVTTQNLSKHAANDTWLLVVKDPRLAFAKIGHLFYPADELHSGAHPSAQIDPSAAIGAGTQIGACAVIGRDVKIGARCNICSNAVIDDGVIMGDDCYIGANTSVSHALIGSRVRISTNVSIGGEGFGFVPGPTGLLRVAQLGRVILEDNVEIGGNCAVDRGTMGDTVIGAGTAIDNLVQIGHNVRIGRHCVIAGQAGVAGSAVIGDFVMIGGQVAVKDHVTVGSHARIAGRTGVMRDVAANESVAGLPAVPVREWHRQSVAIAKLGKRKED